MLGTNKGKHTIEYIPDHVIFDLETTGINCHSDEVIEISAIKVVGGKAEEEFSSLVNPQMKIPYYASEVNGITDDMVADAPTFDAILYDFLEFIGDLPLVGHNICAFDLLFIYRDSEKYFGKVPGNDYVDTLRMARLCLPDIKNYKLTDLAEHFGLETEGAHRALCDCRMNQLVYEKLGEILNSGTVTIKKCHKCGEIMAKRSGKYGPFWGCGGYPNCRYTENII